MGLHRPDSLQALALAGSKLAAQQLDNHAPSPVAPGTRTRLLPGSQAGKLTHVPGQA